MTLIDWMKSYLFAARDKKQKPIGMLPGRPPSWNGCNGGTLINDGLARIAPGRQASRSAQEAVARLLGCKACLY